MLFCAVINDENNIFITLHSDTDCTLVRSVGQEVKSGALLREKRGGLSFTSVRVTVTDVVPDSPPICPTMSLAWMTSRYWSRASRSMLGRAVRMIPANDTPILLFFFKQGHLSGCEHKVVFSYFIFYTGKQLENVPHSHSHAIHGKQHRRDSQWAQGDPILSTALV